MVTDERQNPTTEPDKNEMAAPPILLWDVGEVEREIGVVAWEVSFVLRTKAAAEAWRAWLQQVAPGMDKL